MIEPKVNVTLKQLIAGFVKILSAFFFFLTLNVL